MYSKSIHLNQIWQRCYGTNMYIYFCSTTSVTDKQRKMSMFDGQDNFLPNWHKIWSCNALQLS